MNDRYLLSADVFKYWQIDFQNGTIRIVAQDGRDVEEELQSQVPTAGLPDRLHHLRLGAVVDLVDHHSG